MSRTTDLSLARIRSLVATLLKPLSLMKGMLSEREIEAAVVCFLVVQAEAAGLTPEAFVEKLSKELLTNWADIEGEFAQAIKNLQEGH